MTLRRSLLDPKVFLPGSFMVRRGSLARLGSGRLFAGASDGLISAATQLHCSGVGEPLITSGFRASLTSELCEQPISSLYPEILSALDRRSAAAAAFVDLAARVAISDSSLARELVGLALDCLDELDLKLDAMYSGAVWPDAVLLQEQAQRLSGALDSASGDAATADKSGAAAGSSSELIAN